MKTIALVSLLVIVGLSVNNVSAWDQDELEIFDLVEEINQNFYSILKVEQVSDGMSVLMVISLVYWLPILLIQQASTREIRQAFRTLSLLLHPDKNSAEDANEQFRNLVAVYEVLKDTSKREKYDKVLKDGLPDWKSALYYYRRYRKMGLAEMVALVFVIFTIAQYIVSWAVYAEKKYTAVSIAQCLTCQSICAKCLLFMF